MITAIDFSNFKSFRDQKIRRCSRLNVIVGDNGSGKTALLEGIFLAASTSPEVASRTRAWRGIENQNLSGAFLDIDRALWADLFFGFDETLKPKVTLRGTAEENRSVTISFRKTATKKLIAPTRKNRQTGPTVTTEAEGIRFDWHVTNRGDFTVIPKFTEGKIEYPNVSDQYLRAAFFAANRTITSSELVSRFSKLSVNGREQEFTDTFQKHYPNVSQISVEVAAGNPLLYAKIDTLPNKIPLSAVSGGMYKLAGMLLTITEMENGIVIFDELENGFYYERMPEIWRTLLNFSERYNCQLFISTHSQECLRALQSVIKDEEVNELSFFRIIKKGAESIIREFDGRRIVDAIENKIEVR